MRWRHDYQLHTRDNNRSHASRIFPPATDAASSDASELHFNPHTFRNYAGVEEHEATEKELQLHVDANHLAEFDTYDELSQFVNATEAEPAVLNKIGLIIKVKHDEAGNPDEKARMGALSGKHQRAMLPRLLDAVLRLLYFMSIPCWTRRNLSRRSCWTIRRFSGRSPSHPKNTNSSVRRPSSVAGCVS